MIIQISVHLVTNWKMIMNYKVIELFKVMNYSRATLGVKELTQLHLYPYDLCCNSNSSKHRNHLNLGMKQMHETES